MQGGDPGKVVIFCLQVTVFITEMVHGLLSRLPRALVLGLFRLLWQVQRARLPAAGKQGNQGK